MADGNPLVTSIHGTKWEKCQQKYYSKHVYHLLAYWRELFAYVNHTNSFKPHNNPTEVGPAIIPILLIRLLIPREINNLLRITQPGSGKAGTQTHTFWLQSRAFLPQWQ